LRARETGRRARVSTQLHERVRHDVRADRTRRFSRQPLSRLQPVQKVLLMPANRTRQGRSPMRTAPAGVAAALAILVAGCGSGSSSTGSPSPSPVPGNNTTQVKFIAQLTTAAETPPIVPPDPEAGGTGTANITLNVTKDAAGNISATTADFQVNLNGFPNG